LQPKAPKACNVEQEWVADVVSVCPVLFYGEFDIVFRAYNDMENGHLPFSGGTFEQPAKLMRFVDIIRSEIAGRRNGDG